LWRKRKIAPERAQERKEEVSTDNKVWWRKNTKPHFSFEWSFDSRDWRFGVVFGDSWLFCVPILALKISYGRVWNKRFLAWYKEYSEMVEAQESEPNET
jgi:hypothetical protein